MLQNHKPPAVMDLANLLINELGDLARQIALPGETIRQNISCRVDPGSGGELKPVPSLNG